MKNVIKLFSVLFLVVGAVGVNTLKAQNPEYDAELYYRFNTGIGSLWMGSRPDLEEIGVDDPCEVLTWDNVIYLYSAFKFNRPIKAPAFGPRNLGDDVQFYVKRLTADCGDETRIGNMLFKVDGATKLFISGTNGSVGINTATPQAQFHVEGNSFFSGNVGIGVNPTTAVKLDVAGVVRAHEVKICLNQGCDYVFAEGYNLMSLSNLDKFIKANKHLPEVAPATEMEADGINVSEMSALLLKKIEELTLYIIGQEKQAIQQQKLIEDLQKRLSELEAKKGGE